MMKRNYLVGMGILLIGLIVLLSGCNKDRITGEAVYEDKPIKIGLQVSPASTLLYVANDKGFFKEEGLNVELVGFTAGKFALQAFLADPIDLAESGEVPVMYSSLQGNKFYVISQVVEKTINEVRVVAHKEEGLNNPEDYFKAKKGN